MKKWFLYLLLLTPVFAYAQGFSYDTIKVSADDSRNVHPLREKTIITNKHKDSQPVFDRSKLRFGANLGLSLSRNYTHLGLGPQIGYQFNKYFMAGTGIKYYYSRAELSSYESKDNLLGVNLFGYTYPVRFITIFAQPELNYIWSKLTYKSTGEIITSNGFVPSLIVGAGLRLGYTHITLNYDLAQRHNSPHPDGFFVGISAFF
ncbi:MAG: hypothetical protein PHV53_00850 [Fermentimonas sp.]|nr:hypothetical protein [Fermentimonas sp.]